MQVRILSRNGDLTRDMRRAIERQVRLIVGRHAAAVVRLQLKLRENEDDSPGGSHRCQIQVDLGHGESLSSVEDAVDPVAAAAGAAWRIHRRLRQRRG
jgi:ribosome-associated translation inhibitor RaiA